MRGFSLRSAFYRVRRFALRHFVPERLWPAFVEIGGVPIQVRGTPYSFGTKLTLIRRQYESAERELLDEVPLEGRHVLEMGGSIGVLAAVISQKIGPRGRLVTVEASRQLTEFSKPWLEGLGNVQVLSGYAFPVWEVPADLRINSFDESLGAIAGRVHFSLDTEGGDPDLNSSVLDLKRLVGEGAFAPEVLVVDIEGSEMLLCEVTPRIPPCVQYLLIELHPNLYPAGAADQARLIEVIQRERFSPVRSVSSVHLFRRVSS